MSGRCKERVWNGQFSDYPCSRKDWKDGYCKQHHPDSVKKRREDAYAKFTAKQAKAAAEAARERILQRRQSAENVQLRLENERLREALAWAYNLRHLRGHSDPVVIPERFAPLIEAALRREDV